MHMHMLSHSLPLALAVAAKCTAFLLTVHPRLFWTCRLARLRCIGHAAKVTQQWRSCCWTGAPTWTP